MKNWFTNRWLQMIVAVILALILGVVYERHGLLAHFRQELAQVHPIRASNTNYPLIDPLLVSDGPEFSEKTEYQDLRKQLYNYTDQQISDQKASQISVYFRDLNFGNAVDINPDKQYTPASLFKLPLLIAYLQAAETHPEILQQKIIKTNPEDENANESIKASQSAQPNQAYTVQQLLELMIINSDNNATKMLSGAIDEASFKKVFDDLQVKVPEETGDFITPKEYSFFLRILYNASYLNNEMSQKALELLSRAEFKDGIVSGLPGNLIVAHKFGEYAQIDDNGQVNFRELHDCGIVYYPGHPYFLCVMTKGNNLDDLKGIIKSVSGTVYDAVKKQYP